MLDRATLSLFAISLGLSPTSKAARMASRSSVAGRHATLSRFLSHQFLLLSVGRGRLVMNRRGVVWSLAGLVGALWVALIVSEKGVLVSQRMVNPGETYVVPDWGDLGKNQQASLACRYFVGTRLRWEVFWYSPNGFMGRADCPIFVDR